MHLKMQPRPAPAWMDYIWWHGRVERDKERGFVHVGPDARDSSIQQRLVHCSPPRSRLWISKIGKDTDPWPDGVLIVNSLCCLAIEISLPAFDVNRILLVNLHACIYDIDHVESHFP